MSAHFSCVTFHQYTEVCETIYYCKHFWEEAEPFIRCFFLGGGGGRRELSPTALDRTLTNLYRKLP